MNINPAFIHIPKTAGTSINSALRPLIGKCSMIGHKRYRVIPKPDKRFVFTFVRNPEDRAISTFQYFKERRKPSWPLISQERRIDRKLPKYGVLSAVCENITASQFWETANIEILKTALIHFQPQTFFIDGGSVNLFRFDHLKSEFSRLCTTLGVEEPELPVIRKSNHSEVVLSDLAKANIRKYYQQDFEMWEQLTLQ